jgi:polyhydroxyalkanoate synthase
MAPSAPKRGGICACHAAQFPRKVRHLILTVTPLHFHGGPAEPAPGGGYVNLWARALGGEDIDRLLDLLDDERKLLGFLRMERWIAGRRVDLGAIRAPVLNVAADGDVEVPNGCTLGRGDRFGTRDDTKLRVPGGHIGTFVGGKAQQILAPSIVECLKERC